MGKPMMIQEDDDRRIEKLKRFFGAKSKVEVLRSALSLLEQKAERMAKIVRWKKAAKIVAKTSSEVLQDFQPSSQLHKT